MSITIDITKFATTEPENFVAWLEDLATTTEAQAQGALCEILDTGVRGYCCLGRASVLAGAEEFRPTLQQKNLVLFGAQKASAYLPEEAAAWLGVEGEGDIYLDGLSIILCQDGEPVSSGSELNDTGFTFAQIGDLIRYFGTRRSRT